MPNPEENMHQLFARKRSKQRQSADNSYPWLLLLLLTQIPIVQAQVIPDPPEGPMSTMDVVLTGFAMIFPAVFAIACIIFACRCKEFSQEAIPVDPADIEAQRLEEHAAETEAAKAEAEAAAEEEEREGEKRPLLGLGRVAKK